MNIFGLEIRFARRNENGTSHLVKREECHKAMDDLKDHFDQRISDLSAHLDKRFEDFKDFLMGN